MTFSDDLAKLQLEGNVGKLVDWLTENGVGLEAIGKSKLYQGFHKDEAGDTHIVDMVSIELSPAWSDGPRWPLIDRPVPIKLSSKPRKRVKGGSRTVLCLPDPQIGYWRDMDSGQLEAMHDITAMDVALQIGHDVRPDGVVNLGDLLDMTEFGRYETEPSLDQTTNPSLRTARRFLDVQKQDIGSDEFIVIEGNHDKRLADAIARHNRSALYIRKADATPDDWPVFSVPYLLGLDDLGVEYVEGYPAGQHWLTDSFVVEHGKRVASGSSTAAKYAAATPGVSAVFGHVHRLEVHTKSLVLGPDEVRRSVFISPGCLCRTDGAVPSFGSGTSANGKPVTNHEDWQQGCVVLTFHDDVLPQVEPVFINNGQAMFRGELYTAGAYKEVLEVDE